MVFPRCNSQSIPPKKVLIPKLWWNLVMPWENDRRRDFYLWVSLKKQVPICILNIIWLFRGLHFRIFHGGRKRRNFSGSRGANKALRLIPLARMFRSCLGQDQPLNWFNRTQGQPRPGLATVAQVKPRWFLAQVLAQASTDTRATRLAICRPISRGTISIKNQLQGVIHHCWTDIGVPVTQKRSTLSVREKIKPKGHQG